MDPHSRDSRFGVGAIHGEAERNGSGRLGKRSSRGDGRFAQFADWGRDAIANGQLRDI